jgi:flavodoxin
MNKIVIVDHSGHGDIRKVVETVAEGRGGALLGIDAEARVPEGAWEQLAAADAIVFCPPTYMGTLSWQFNRFEDASSEAWYTQDWKKKLAAAFTDSASMKGEKLSTLHDLFCAQPAAQHVLGRFRHHAHRHQGRNPQRHQLCRFVLRSDDGYSVGRVAG